VTDVGLSESLALVASVLAGAAIGLFFFGGLWLTVRGMNRARHPVLRLLVSLLLRLGLALGAFYVFIRHGGWPHAAAAALGFVLLRMVVIRRARVRRPEKELEA
jgi:F1F0 ATPase subunit 2